MEEFFRGLDGRLRVSGMLADSIMMGIVNSAMENAHKKSCSSKEGHLVRLNEKSRFCELAIMQLEWCLKFLKEETQDSSIVESNCDRQKLLSDLLVTRDRIHNRLTETELMIAEKDRELAERMEIESNLRFALEVKDEDITSLNTALGLEREKRIRSKKSMEKIGILGIGEVDEQLCKIKAKLEDGQHNLESLMRRISSRSFDFDKLIPEFDVGEEQGTCSHIKDVNSRLMFEGVQSLNLEIEFKEMALDMDILKVKIDSSFKTMASSVSLFKTILDEQRWAWNAERDTVNFIIKCFLMEVQHKCSVDHVSSIEDVFSMPLDTNLFTFMDDIASLHEELEKLAPEINMVKLGDEVSTQKDEASLRSGNVSGPSKRNDDGAGEGDQKDASMFSEADCTEDLSEEESPSCLSVAQKIRTHEFIIRTKSQESDSLKGEKSREKGHSNSTLRSERSLDSVKDMIARVNSSVESIMKEKAKFIMHYDDLKCTVRREENPLQKKLSGFILGEGENPLQMVAQSMRESPEQLCSRSSCNLVDAEICEKINQLSQEKEDIVFKSILLEETYSIIFTGLVKRMHDDVDCNVGTQVRDDIYKNIVREMIEEWSNNIEAHNMERMFMDETYHYVLSEVVKDSYALNLSALNGHNEDLLVHNDQSQNYQVSIRYDTIQEPNGIPNNVNLIDGPEIDFSSRPVESNIHLHLGQSEHEESNEQEDAFRSPCGRYGKEFQQQKSKVHLKEVISSIVVPPDGEGGLNNQFTQVIGSIPDAKCSRCLLTRLEERPLDELQSIMVPLTEISKTIIDFEVIACGKIRRNMTRLEDLNHHVPFLIEQTVSIKKQQSLYQKAFTRRCYDLQTAEAEVDLLGDEVDLLDSLVEKIYIVLDHYSPVLQHYFGIMDVLWLIKKQLHGEETCTARCTFSSSPDSCQMLSGGWWWGCVLHPPPALSPISHEHVAGVVT